MTRDADHPVESERVARALVAVLLSLGLLVVGAFVVVSTERASDDLATAPTVGSTTAATAPGETPLPLRVALVPAIEAIAAARLPGGRAIVPAPRALGRLHRGVAGPRDRGLAPATPQRRTAPP